MKIRPLEAEFDADRQTDRQTDVLKDNNKFSCFIHYSIQYFLLFK
jgi:hypothetical protein